MKKKLLELQKKLIERFPNNASKPILVDNIFVTKLLTDYPTLNQFIEIFYYNLFDKYEICKYINGKEVFTAEAKGDNEMSEAYIMEIYSIMMVTENKVEVAADVVSPVVSQEQVVIEGQK